MFSVTLEFLYYFYSTPDGCQSLTHVKIYLSVKNRLFMWRDFMSRKISTSEALAEVLFMHFGVRDAKELVLRPLVFDVRLLTVLCENISVPFKGTLYTHIQAVSTVDESLLLWLGCPLLMHFRKAEFGFDAKLQCGKIYYDRHGLRPIVECLDSEKKTRIHHAVKCSIEIDMGSTVHPR